MSVRFSVMVAGPGGSSHELLKPDAEALRIGRDEECDVVLSSPSVSRFHLRVEALESGIRIADESHNGTLLDRRFIRARSVVVADQAEARIGPYALQIVAERSGFTLPPDSPETRREIHRELLEQLDLSSMDPSTMSAPSLRPKVADALSRIVDRRKISLADAGARSRLIEEMIDEVLGLGPLQKLLDDDEVSEIMVADPGTIYVEKNGRIELTPFSFMDDESCRSVIERIITPLGRRIDESVPLVDARLQDGSRVNAVIPPLAIRGPCITIRKFTRSPVRMEHLVSGGALDEQMSLFLRRCVRARKNVVVSGGTGSGKTTLLNVLSAEISASERIVTIEDAAELQLDQPHVVALESRPSNLEGRGEYSIRDLLRNALRMRPDRIVVGECRGGEAIDMLQAMNTGHEGSMTTTHANSPWEAIKRIETLCMMSHLDLSLGAIREQLSSSLHVVVQLTRFADGSRRITSIAEVGPTGEDAEVSLHEIFHFNRVGTDPSGAVVGNHRSTGYVPSFLSEFIELGLARDGAYL